MEGTLHPLALMNFMPLQFVNGRLTPPARDLNELLSVAERGAVKSPARPSEALGRH